jgi:hypothetical protein
MSEFPDHDAVLTQFNLLMGELLAGEIRRSHFRPWEIDILLDVKGCAVRGSRLYQILREYQKAVQAELEKQAQFPLRFSDFLERREKHRARRKSTREASRDAVSRKKRVG